MRAPIGRRSPLLARDSAQLLLRPPSSPIRTCGNFDIAIDGSSVLELLDRLLTDRDVSILSITHVLQTARLLADQVIVPKAGRVVEQGPALDDLDHPDGTTTPLLLEAVPESVRGVSCGVALTVPIARPGHRSSTAAQEAETNVTTTARFFGSEPGLTIGFELP